MAPVDTPKQDNKSHRGAYFRQLEKFQSLDFLFYYRSLQNWLCQAYYDKVANEIVLLC